MERYLLIEGDGYLGANTYIILVEFNPPFPPNNDEFSPLLLFDIRDLRKLRFVHVPRKALLFAMEDTDKHPVPHDDVRVLGEGLEVLVENDGGSSAGIGFFGRIAGEDFGGRCRQRLLCR